ncbi:MAG: hypothetical protein ACXWC9_10140 [Pseudobdellovibrionaceae bacterium]
MKTYALKALALMTGLLAVAPTWACDYSTADSMIEKELYVMAKRYDSKKVGLGVSIRNGQAITTSIAIFQGRGGSDGVPVDRIGSITVDLDRCIVYNTLVGTFDVLETPN